MDFFYGLWMIQGYQLNHSLSIRFLNLSLIMFFLNIVDYQGLIRSSLRKVEVLHLVDPSFMLKSYVVVGVTNRILVSAPVLFGLIGF